MAQRKGLKRLATPVAGSAVLVTAGISLASCAYSHGLALARQACGHVDRSIALYDRSLTQAPSQARSDQALALQQLQAALPIAATAAGEDAQWEALATTLSQSAHVSEDHLVHALQAQCSAAQSTGLAPVTTTSAPAETTVTAPEQIGR